MAPKTSAKFQPKDIVLAKMTGFPAWPSFVMPEDMISDVIMKAKKKSTNICVIFIPDGDFNWMNEKSLEALTPEKLKSKLSKLPKNKLKHKPRKNGARTNNVVEALVAADGLEFDEFMEELAENADEDDVDELENDGDEPVLEESTLESASAGKSLKRKKRKASVLSDNEADDSQGNAADASATPEAAWPNLSRKQGQNGRERGSNGSANKKSRKFASPSKEADSGLAGAQTGKSRLSKRENGTTSPRTMSEKDKQHHFWLCRVKLQRSLIQRNQSATPKDPKQFPPPSVDELSFARLILNRLNLFPVNVDLLRETKIHKVLKCILKDKDLAYPESFRLHEKCEELLKKWKESIAQLKHEKQAKSESRALSKLARDGDESASDAATSSGAVSNVTANTTATGESKL
ncbi:hypothetical protein METBISCDRAFT_25625 [Metschnikowia bicuspidata]|uniref:PWWP domain-containing protein n=1 Tax=Metschnikowia bicuspidata TaxID=27322 RepID=A0A4P9ZH00_9ASCO|nr:hypothetical protein METBISCDRAFT_25625 [Metschnikowia bicuspidata]